MEKGAFTLVELLVVIAIISILAAMISPSAFRAIEKAKVSAFCSDVKTVRSGVFALYSDTGRLPCHYESIVCPLINGADCGAWGAVDYPRWQNVAGWDGPYIEKDIQYYWTGRGQMTFQNSAHDRNKDWDGDSGSELFFCYQPGPPITAQVAIDNVLDGGDGPKSGMIRARIDYATWGTGCFWPGFADQ